MQILSEAKHSQIIGEFLAGSSQQYFRSKGRTVLHIFVNVA